MVPGITEREPLDAQGQRRHLLTWGADLPVAAVTTTALITLAWTLYRAMTDLPGWTDALVAKPLLWLGPVLLAVALVERRPRPWLSLSPSRPRPGHGLAILGRDLALGAGAAALLAAWVLRGHELHPVSVYGPLVWPLATAAVEETLYRGYLMARLWAWCGDAWTANLLSAAAFALIHLPLLVLDQGQGLVEALTTLRTILALGIGLGWLFGRTRGLAAPIAAHAVWDGAVTWFG
ncbi:MAG: CPBP family intramembrane metalloprotease [Chloroflexota bacterium]|nr:CPBP family intramembrane metalloprotease [Chloroflexota bacterium]